MIHSALENYQEFRDLEDILTEFRAIVASDDPIPSVELFTKIATHFQKLKQINDAKKAFSRILQLDKTHPNVSRAYFDKVVSVLKEKAAAYNGFYFTSERRAIDK